MALSNDQWSDREEKLINETLTRAMLLLPEVIGNLIIQKETTRRLSMEFYKKNPNFAKHPDVVGSTLEKCEGENPGMQYGDLMELAAPLIKERIDIIEKMGHDRPNKPTDFNFKGKFDFGEI